MNNTLIDLDDGNFGHEVLNAPHPVLVQFWAGWSDPCRAMGSWLETVAQHGPLKVARVNVENHEELTERCGVNVVPTLLLYDQGTVRHQIDGRATELEVREKLNLP